MIFSEKMLDFRYCKQLMFDLTSAQQARPQAGLGRQRPLCAPLHQRHPGGPPRPRRSRRADLVFFATSVRARDATKVWNLKEECRSDGQLRFASGFCPTRLYVVELSRKFCENGRSCLYEGSVYGERANFTGVVLGRIENDLSK